MTLQTLLTDYPDEKLHRNQIATTVNELTKGRANNFGNVTLTASATSTVVADARIKSSMVVFLSPRTANAAGAWGTTYISAVADGSFTITHANAATLDRDFWYHFHG